MNKTRSKIEKPKIGFWNYYIPETGIFYVQCDYIVFIIRHYPLIVRAGVYTKLRLVLLLQLIIYRLESLLVVAWLLDWILDVLYKKSNWTIDIFGIIEVDEAFS